MFAKSLIIRTKSPMESKKSLFAGKKVFASIMLPAFLLQAISVGLFVAVPNAKAAAPTISAMTFAGKAGSVSGGDSVSFNLSGVTDADLASTGSITVSDVSTLVINVITPSGIVPVSTPLVSGKNDLGTAQVLGYNILASEFNTTIAAFGGSIPVSGTLTNSLSEVTNLSINITANPVVTPPAVTPVTPVSKKSNNNNKKHHKSHNKKHKKKKLSQTAVVKKVAEFSVFTAPQKQFEFRTVASIQKTNPARFAAMMKVFKQYNTVSGRLRLNTPSTPYAVRKTVSMLDSFNGYNMYLKYSAKLKK